MALRLAILSTAAKWIGSHEHVIPRQIELPGLCGDEPQGEIENSKPHHAPIWTSVLLAIYGLAGTRNTRSLTSIGGLNTHAIPSPIGGECTVRHVVRVLPVTRRQNATNRRKLPKKAPHTHAHAEDVFNRKQHATILSGRSQTLGEEQIGLRGLKCTYPTHTSHKRRYPLKLNIKINLKHFWWRSASLYVRTTTKYL